MHIRRLISQIVIALFVVLPSAHAADTVTAADQKQVIERIIEQLNDKYPFAEARAKMIEGIRAKEASGAYASIHDGREFARHVTDDLQAFGKDKHVYLDFNPDVMEVKNVKITELHPPAEAMTELEQQSRHDNYGTPEVRVLDGNIGYVNFKMLAALEFAADTYAATMRFVSKTDALIFDLRECGGAHSNDDVPFLAGYLFERPVHLEDIYIGNQKTPTQQWSAAYVPGPLYKKPVYMLTSGATFSGCEAFAYELQAYKRATIVGEHSGGGANPNAALPITEHFVFSTPFAHAENPVTKSNWEGTGVKPDVAVAPELALHQAQILAVTESRKTQTDQRWASYLDELADRLRANPPQAAQTVAVDFDLAGNLEAKSISIIGDFNRFDPAFNPMTRTAKGWHATVKLTPGRHYYLFFKDGANMLDPARSKAKHQETNFRDVK